MHERARILMFLGKAGEITVTQLNGGLIKLAAAFLEVGVAAPALQALRTVSPHYMSEELPLIAEHDEELAKAALELVDWMVEKQIVDAEEISPPDAVSFGLGRA